MPRAKTKAKPGAKKRPWSKTDEAELRRFSREKKAVASISRVMKRTQGALRQKAFDIGISLGHRARRRTRRK